MDWQKILASMPEQYYKYEEGAIYCGDSRKIMKYIPDDSIDIIISSPIYPGVKKWNVFKNKTFEECHQILNPVWDECYRVTSKGGLIALNIGNSSGMNNEAYLGMYFHKRGYKYCHTLTWKKYGKGSGGRGNFGTTVQYPFSTFYYPNWGTESILIYSKGKKRLSRANKLDIEKIRAEGFDSNVWEIPGDITTKHVAPYPEKLVEKIIEFYTDNSFVVLDPYLGSGTTAVVAKRMGRKCIGIETVPEFCEMAKKRIGETKAFKGIHT